MTDLGKRIRQLRLGMGLSLDDLHLDSKVAKQTIFDIERGTTQSPNANTLKKLATALETTVEHLLQPEIKIFSPAPFSVDAPRPAYLKWNAPDLRPGKLELISPMLAPDPVEVTRFIHHLEVLHDFGWLHDPAHVQTSTGTMEFFDVWSDPDFFRPYEATLLRFDKAGRQVDRLFQIELGRTASDRYVSMVRRVLLRHRALALRPRIIVLNDAYSMNNDIGVACDALVVLDAASSLILNYPTSANPVFVRSDNRKFAAHASNIFLDYWQRSADSQAFLDRYPASERDLKAAEREAELVNADYELFRSRWS